MDPMRYKVQRVNPTKKKGFMLQLKGTQRQTKIVNQELKKIGVGNSEWS